LPLGAAPAPPFQRPRRFSLHPAPPDILSDLVSPHGISPRFRAFSGWCRFSSHRVSLPGFRTATFARSDVPLRVSLLSGGTCHCRLSLTALSFLRISRFFAAGELPLASNAFPHYCSPASPVPFLGLLPLRDFPFCSAFTLPGFLLPCLFSRLRSFTPGKSP
jgi:hypothetical protein